MLELKFELKILMKKELVTTQIIETTVGRVLFNEKVPEAAGYINEVLTKKSLKRYYW